MRFLARTLASLISGLMGKLPSGAALPAEACANCAATYMARSFSIAALLLLSGCSRISRRCEPATTASPGRAERVHHGVALHGQRLPRRHRRHRRHGRQLLFRPAAGQFLLWLTGPRQVLPRRSLFGQVLARPALLREFLPRPARLG